MGDRDYEEALTLRNLLPPLYMKVLKEPLLYNNIYLGHDMDFAEFAEIKWNGRKTRVKLPDIRCEEQRHDFWYRSGYRANILMQ